MAPVPRAYREAAERWGYLAEGQAHRYGVANGATLLLKIASGESGFNMGAVSSAGARGATQFEPETRASFIKQYGVDPWKSPDEAIHATALFLQHLGFAAYNPGGGQKYIDYIKGQPVGIAHPGSGRTSVHVHPESAPPSPTSSSSAGGLSGDLMHLGLVGVLVIGGVVMVGMGTTRLLGTAKTKASK